MYVYSMSTPNKKEEENARSSSGVDKSKEQSKKIEIVNARHKEVMKASTFKGAESLTNDANHEDNENVSSFSSEDLDFSGFTDEETKVLSTMISRQVGKAIKNVMPYYISQTTHNLKVIIQKELEKFKHGGILNDFRNEMATYWDFTACDVPKFDGTLNPIASTRWLSIVEGGFHTSCCKEKNKVNFASNFLRNSAKTWWDGKICKKGEEWIGLCTCNQLGHKANECPNPMVIEAKPFKSIKEEKVEKAGVSNLKARVYVMATEEDKVVHDVVTGREIIIYGDIRKGDFKLCSIMKARKYLLHGCYACVAHVIDTSFEKKSAKDVSIVNEFLDVFPEDLSGIPPERQVEF
ncbi:hypothetical protein Tco_1504874 [Tanacetum coccineum]